MINKNLIIKIELYTEKIRLKLILNRIIYVIINLKRTQKNPSNDSQFWIPNFKQ